MTTGDSLVKPESDPGPDRDVLLRLLSVTATFAGLCMAALGFIQYGTDEQQLRAFADEVIALDALLFLCCVYLILWALRTTSRNRARQLVRVIDAIFLFALTTMLLASSYIVYRVF